MTITLNFGVVLQIIALILSMSIIVYIAFRGKKSSLVYNYIWCLALIFIWAFGEVFELSSKTFDERWIFVRLEYFAICFIGYRWLLFCFYYTESKMSRNIYWRIIPGIPPAITYLALLTNEYHKMFFPYFVFDKTLNQYGIFFWANVSLTYIYVLFGAILLVKYYKENIGYAKKQSLMLTLTVIFPLSTNALTLANILSGYRIFNANFDMTPVSFAFSLLFFTIATFRYRFLNILTVAYKVIVDNMREIIIVIDNSNKITTYNESFIRTFTDFDINLDNSLTRFCDYIKTISSNDNDLTALLDALENGSIEPMNGELTLDGTVNRAFWVNIQPLFDNNGESIGRIVSYNDITDYKMLMDELNIKNNELIVKNDQLKEYADTVEELAVTKERNRFARDVHDTLGHSMTLLIALLEVSCITARTNPEKTEEKINDALNTARDGLKELRRSISGLAPEKLDGNSVVSAIKKMVSDFTASGVEVDLSIQGSDDDFNFKGSYVLYRTCQEAMTNSARHGKAKHITIILKNTSNTVKLFVFDDGIGCKKINKGQGLKGMGQRISELGGSFNYGSDGESGFNIRIEIPIGGSNND